MQYASLGSVSTGTLRTEDLIGAMADTLQDLLNVASRTGLPDKAHVQLVADAAEWLEQNEGRGHELGAHAEDNGNDHFCNGDEIVGELSDALNEYAAPFCYFGHLRGDGADIGFWFSSAQFEEACRDGACVKVSDLGEATPDVVNGADYVAVVSDHGNVTVYTPRLEFTEVLSVV